MSAEERKAENAQAVEVLSHEVQNLDENSFPTLKVIGENGSICFFLLYCLQNCFVCAVVLRTLLMLLITNVLRFVLRSTFPLNNIQPSILSANFLALGGRRYALSKRKLEQRWQFLVMALLGMRPRKKNSSPVVIRSTNTWNSPFISKLIVLPHQLRPTIISRMPWPKLNVLWCRYAFVYSLCHYF